eukprot:scaffold3315_cov353-Prasinococcus_capsulatus_cf.AAC.6
MAVAALPPQAGACTSGAARGLASSKLALRGRHLQAPHRPTQSRAWRTERGGSAPRLVVRARRREQMEDSKSPYEVLGVAPTAGARDIKRAYRQKVKSVHPDVARDSSPETIASFLELQRAYEVLSSPESRRRFDAGEMSARWAERAAMTRAAAQKDLARERVRRARLERERQAEMEANLIRSITWLMIAWPLSYILAFAVQVRARPPLRARAPPPLVVVGAACADSRLAL